MTFAHAAAAMLAAAVARAPVERRFALPAPTPPAFRVRHDDSGGWAWWCATPVPHGPGTSECGKAGLSDEPHAAAAAAVAHLNEKHMEEF
ncbi:hypothetical protein [Streptomyces sp. NPDC087300]|uniref:hypothetical protein n=1 Tax=Streptomyces sp. NPDC087300 TaxID=3365780 RepID=UPI003817F40F